ncbi:MAG: histidine--tRNA ligase [Candidatus Omnitrophota bacterium]|nr:histidine--tRNA ligase [Candidatus Omnitrophota bacterium]
MKFISPRGTKDILPQDLIKWDNVERICRSLFKLYGFEEIRTPLFEETNLFIRSLGNTTDIVQKQMLNLQAEKPSLSLRPEATASVVRSYIEHDLFKTQGFAKLFYIAPMFRGERPQKGRLRQFHHIGVEAIGVNSAFLDAEIISLAYEILRRLGIENFQLKINSLGCKQDKESLAKNLKELLKKKISLLCQNCRLRFNKNIFRILDCKVKSCQEIVGNIDFKNDYLCTDCLQYSNEVKSALNKLNIPFKVMPHLVRGLDYYTHTVFEISHKDLGSQDAIGAGGRYNNLVKELGGPDIGAVGFALGFERILMVLKEQIPSVTSNDVFIATLGRLAFEQGFIILDKLRKAGVAAQIDFDFSSLKSQLRLANRLKSKLVVMLGDEELKQNIALLKDMATGNQERIVLVNLVEEIKKRL